MKHPLHRLFAIAAAAWLAAGAPLPAVAQVIPTTRRSPDQLVRPRVVADVKQIKPGQTFNLVVDFRLDPGWHLYWKNPGAGAAPIEADLTVPNGFTAGDIRFPRPMVIEGPVGDMYGYEERVALFIPVTPPPTLSPQQAIFSVDLAWAVCDDKVCHMGSTLKMVTVPATNLAGGDPIPSDDPGVARGRQCLPIAASDAGVAMHVEDGVLIVSGPAGGHTTATFFPLGRPGVTCGKPGVTFDAGRFTLRVPVTIDANNLRGNEPVVGGVVALGSEPDDTSYEFEESWASLQAKSP